MPNGIKALLFDLDDTLLINDMDAFSSVYFRALGKKLEKVCPPDLLIKSVQLGTRAMLRNDGTNGTNAEVFSACFFQRVKLAPETLMPIFDDFYEHDFDALRVITRPDPAAIQVVHRACALGYQVAIATQPLFPLVAIEARLRWAGVGPERFAYDAIATYDTFSACKPHPVYFSQLLEKIGRQPPNECLMIGDSIESDMPASRYGIKTLLVDRGQRVSSREIACDASGTLGDLLRMMDSGGIDEL